jgi:hypothetical protein
LTIGSGVTIISGVIHVISSDDAEINCAIPIQSLTKSFSGTAALTGDLEVTDAVTLTAGALELGNNLTLSVGGNWTRTVGTFDGSNGTVEFTAGSGSLYILNPSGSTFGKLTITRSSITTRLTSNMTV